MLASARLTASSRGLWRRGPLKWVLPVVAGACAWASPIAQAQPARTVDLRPRWEKGSESTLVMTIDSRNEVGGGGDAGLQTMKQEITLRERVVEGGGPAQEKGAVVELIFERVKVRIDTDLGGVEFDSADPNYPDGKPSGPGGKKGDMFDEAAAAAVAPLVQQLKRMAGTTLKVTMNPDGTIASVEGGGGLATGFMGPVGGLDASKDGLADLFGPISSLGKGSGVDPAKVKVGTKWTHNDELSLQPLGGLSMVTQHTLKSVKADDAEVYFQGSLEPKSSGQNAPVRIKQGTYRGTYQWDTRLGRLKGLSTEQETVVETGTAAGGTSMKSKATMKVVRQPGAPAKRKP